MESGYIYASARRHPESALLTPLQHCVASSRVPSPHRALPISAVPHLHRPIPPRRRHVPSALARVHRHTHHGAHVRQQLHRRVRQIRCPQRHAAVLVPEVDHRVVLVLRHRRARAHFRAVLDEQLPRGCVLVLQVARVADAREQPVVRQELEARWLDVRF